MAIFKNDYNKIYCDIQPWSLSPNWATWRAIDSDGKAHWFSEKPSIDLVGGSFKNANSASEEAGKLDDKEMLLLEKLKWWNTLQKRPINLFHKY